MEARILAGRRFNVALSLSWGWITCPFPIGCVITAGISGAVNGVGGSVSLNPAPFWRSANWADTTVCDARPGPGCVALGMPTTRPSADGYWVWEGTPQCAWLWERLGSTPIIIDTDGSGFHLTSVKDGIKWDFYGDGKPFQIAWTASGSTNGWLAMPDKNGQITSARQLFSNIANQRVPGIDNGFNALAVYDTNADGVINAEDAPYWQELRVWIDANHDGISQPEELHRLDDIGIHSISLKYAESPYVDPFGNEFKLRGHLNPDRGDDVSRVIFDVTLQ